MKHVVPTEIAWVFGQLLLATARVYILRRVRFETVPVEGEQPTQGCWVWTGSGDGRYGHAHFMGQRFKAHRLSYLAFSGRIPRGRVVDHKECDNPPCCCPDHLRAVTQSANIRRCFATGRGRSPFLKQE